MKYCPHQATSDAVYGCIRQKGGHRHNSDNESIQCERQKLWFLCPLIPTGFIELGKKDYRILPVALQQPDQFPPALPLNNRLMLNCR